MQRDPYISEMKSRFLGSRQETLTMDSLEQTNLLPEQRPDSRPVSIFSLVLSSIGIREIDARVQTE